MIVSHRCLVLAAFCTAWLALPPAAVGYSFGSLVTPLGPEEMVFDGPGSCPPPPGVDPPPLHTVDGAARAFRDARGRVQMPLVGGVNRRLVGPSLNDLAPDCRVVLAAEPDVGGPSSYNNWEWLAAPYRRTDGSVVALLHNEYHGIAQRRRTARRGWGTRTAG